MVDGLLINGQDAFDTYGVIMGDDFLNQLNTPAGLKEFISFDSRVADGAEYLVKDTQNQPYARLKPRDLTLKFRIFGADYVTVSGVIRNATLAERQASLQERLEELLAVFQAGMVAIQVPALNNCTYNLLYLGQSISYNLSLDRTTCLFGAKFVEPDPTDRETLPPNFALKFVNNLENVSEEELVVTNYHVSTRTWEKKDYDELKPVANTKKFKINKLPPNVVMGLTNVYGSQTDYRWYTKNNVVVTDTVYNTDGTLENTSTFLGNVTSAINMRGTNTLYFRKTSSTNGLISVAEVKNWINNNKIHFEVI